MHSLIQQSFGQVLTKVMRTQRKRWEHTGERRERERERWRGRGRGRRRRRTIKT